MKHHPLLTRALGIVLCAMLLVGCLPAHAFAAEYCDSCRTLSSEYCADCLLCGDCTDLTYCNPCGEYACSDCRYFCPLCGACENCAALCNGCGFCPDCADGSCFQCGDPADTPSPAGCPECGREPDGVYCADCLLCTGCEPIRVCPICDEGFCETCRYFCPTCGACENCAVLCNGCGYCPDCADGSCFQCGDPADTPSFEYCGNCRQPATEYCADCLLCGDCADLTYCNSCGEYACADCRYFCPTCGACENCAALCNGCGFCPDCADGSCFQCGDPADTPSFEYCSNCGQQTNEYCEQCGLCSDCETLCSVCGLVCSSCAPLCADCGACDECEQLCRSCEAICASCSVLCVECGICETCAPLCADCGTCDSCTDIYFCDSCGDSYCFYCREGCPECGACFNCADPCPLCHDYCSNCSYTCADCGGCEHCVTMCDNCGRFCADCSGDQCPNCDHVFHDGVKLLPTITIDGLDRPTAGQAPDTDITVSNPELYGPDASYGFGGVHWYDPDGALLTPEDTFEAGVTYQVEIKLTVVTLDGVLFVKFDSNPSATLNGKTVDADNVMVGNSGTTAYVYAYYECESDALKGDLNGDGKINIQDAVALYYHVNGKTLLDDTTGADMNGDNKINITDAVTLYYFVNGKTDTL